MATCAQQLPMTVEQIGEVDLVQMVPGSPVFQIVDRNNVLPRNAVRMVNSAFAGSFPVLRVTSFDFDAKVKECVSVLEYEYCQYTQSYELIVQGQSIYSKMSDVKFRDDGEIVDLCYAKIFEALFGFGVSKIPNPLAFVGLQADGADSSQANAAFAAMLGNQKRRDFGTIAPTRISASAVQRIVDLAITGVPARRDVPRAADLASLVSGSAEIADVIADLGDVDDPTVQMIGMALQQALQPIRVGEGITSDDAFIAVAARALADQRRGVAPVGTP